MKIVSYSHIRRSYFIKSNTRKIKLMMRTGKSRQIDRYNDANLDSTWDISHSQNVQFPVTLANCRWRYTNGKFEALTPNIKTYVKIRRMHNINKLHIKAGNLKALPHSPKHFRRGFFGATSSLQFSLYSAFRHRLTTTNVLGEEREEQ